jgi:hypothetical protein
MYRYLISYIDPPTAQTGNCELTLQAPIRSMDDVQSLTRSVAQRFSYVNPIILGFSRFEEER